MADPKTPITRGAAGPVNPDVAPGPAPAQAAFPENPKAASIDRATGQPAKLATGPEAPDPKISPDAAKSAKDAAPAGPKFFGGGTLNGQTSLPEKGVRDANEYRIRHAEGVDVYTLADPGFEGAGGDTWQYSRTEPVYRAPTKPVVP